MCIRDRYPNVTGENLKATIEKHNGYIDNGEDLDFGKVMASTMVKICLLYTSRCV